MVFSTIYLSLVGLFPTIGDTKKAVIPTPGLFIERKNAVSFKNFCKNIESLTYIAATKKRNTHTLKKENKQPALLFHAARNTSYTHTYTHKKTMKSLFYLPTLTIPPPLGPKALDFSRRLPRARMVADKKEQGF